MEIRYTKENKSDRVNDVDTKEDPMDAKPAAAKRCANIQEAEHTSANEQVDPACPCRRIRCKIHGICSRCRAAHAGSGKGVPCDKK